MTADDRRPLVDQYDADPAERLGMAAAHAAVEAVALMNRALASSGGTQRELAARLGVSEGRVSQVLNGDGNVRVSTLARFLRAAGHQLRLEATPVDDPGLPLPVADTALDRLAPEPVPVPGRIGAT